MKALLGRKLGMTQLFDENGTVARVTIVEAGPCVITQIKTTERDGYEAVQIGFGAAKHPAKPQVGHATFNEITPKQFKEFRTNSSNTADETTAEVESEEGENNKQAQPKVGSTLKVDQFEAGDAVEVVGTSKGKGFAGTVKRHNFSTGPKSHGSHNYRAPGSIGSGYPQHVFKGMKMAGRMGGQQTCVKGLKIVHVDSANNLLAISGAVPGPRKGIVVIRGTK
ncbi:MAG TPA: 50S ribosomal protein L3 [Candidatus Saccharimonadales bacterium]|nr:50S ribosomal protein L3 [Candidatus Saccharimonadales bacterium]